MTGLIHQGSWARHLQFVCPKQKQQRILLIWAQSLPPLISSSPIGIRRFSLFIKVYLKLVYDYSESRFNNGNDVVKVAMSFAPWLPIKQVVLQYASQWMQTSISVRIIANSMDLVIILTENDSQNYLNLINILTCSKKSLSFLMLSLLAMYIIKSFHFILCTTVQLTYKPTYYIYLLTIIQNSHSIWHYN